MDRTLGMAPLRAVRGIMLLLVLLAIPIPALARSAKRAALAHADSLAAKAESLSRVGRPAAPELLQAARGAFAIREQLLGPDDSRTLTSLERLASVHLGRVESYAADSLMQRAVAARATVRPRDPHALLVSIAALAETHRGRKRLAEAAKLADSALTQLPVLASRDVALECRLRITRGNVSAELGRSDEALEQLQRAVRIQDAQARPDSAILASALYGLGRALDIAGDMTGSITAFDRAALIKERTQGPESAELATILLLAASPLASTGDYVAQRRHAERAMAIRERVFGPAHPNLAPALWAIAHAEAMLGDPQAAQVNYQKAVDILRAAPGAMSADLATSLSNLGSNCLRLGDGPGALANLREARAMRLRLFGPGRGGGFWSETRLAHAMLMSGDVNGAAQALDTLIAGPMRRAPDEAVDAYFVRGGARRALGRFAEAHADFDRAYALDDSLLGPSSPVTLAALALRAVVRYPLGDRAGAFSDAERAETASRVAIREIARGLSEHEALGYERVRGSGLDVLVALAADSIGLAPDARARVLDAVIQSRLVVLDELADERLARPSTDAALDVLHRRLESARNEYAAAMVAALRESRAPDSLAAAARERREQAERELAAQSGPFREAVQRSGADLAKVATALPAEAALVSYVRHTAPADVTDNATSDFTVSGVRTYYSAFVLRAGSHVPTIVPLGAGADVEQRVERWIRACATPPPPGRAGAAAATRRCDALGRSVRAAIWTPLERAIAGASSVYVVPDGALHAINFLALPDAAGGYLAERGPLVHRLTAERDLVPWIAAAIPPRGLLAFGGIDFDRCGDSPAPLLAASEPVAGRRVAIADTLRVQFAPLPATALEIDEVAETWRSNAASADANVVVARSGAAASEAEFRRLAPGCRVLHLATHGFALGMGGAPAAQAGTRGVGVATAHPAPVPHGRFATLLPGLALAGANRAALPGVDDGFLTAEEITSLDLSGVEWAVLSACQSGLSDPDAVEAVQGLHRAFRRAGARTVIMSLWLVDDAATRDWMGKLYEGRLARHLSTAASVREACRGWLRERRARGLDTHPFYWAAFVATGDWH